MVSADVKRCLLFFVAAGLLQVGVAVWETSGRASFGASFALEMIEFAGFLAAMVALPTGALAFGLSWPLRSPRLRRASGYLMLIPICFVAAMLVAQPLQATLRDRQLRSVVIRGNELVAAISAYEKAQGRAPDSLAVLVPNYIAAVPGTGMAAFPEFRYAPSDGGEWLLTTPVFVRGASYAALEFRPSQKYPPGAQRIAEWALEVNG